MFYIDGYDGWLGLDDDEEKPKESAPPEKEEHDCMFHYSKVVGACIKCEPEKDPRNRTDLWGVIGKDNK